MSTQPETLYTFDTPDALPMPTKVNVGVVTEVSDGYISPKSGNYIVQPIQLEALDAGQNTKVYLLYRPEWFVKGFRVKNLAEVEGERKGAHWVYLRHIRDTEEMSYLRGLCGSDEAFDRLGGIIFNLPVNEQGFHELEDVSAAIRDFLLNNVDESGNPVKVGYVLSQARVKTGEKDADGKNVYRLEKKYNLAGKNPFFDATEKNLKRWQNRAERSEGKIVMTYESF